MNPALATIIAIAESIPAEWPDHFSLSTAYSSTYGVFRLTVGQLRRAANACRELEAEHERLAESERREGARARDMHAAEQSLAKALGYPVIPEHAGAVPTGDYCAGEQTLTTLAVEALMTVRDLRDRLEKRQAAIVKLAESIPAEWPDDRRLVVPYTDDRGVMMWLDCMSLGQFRAAAEACREAEEGA